MLVQFERAGIVVIWWVESKRDRIGVLQGSIESIAEVHEECITVPLEAVLDIGIREL